MPVMNDQGNPKSQFLIIPKKYSYYQYVLKCIVKYSIRLQYDITLALTWSFNDNLYPIF